MCDPVYILREKVAAYIQRWVQQDRFDCIEIIPVDNTDPSEEYPKLHETHVKIFVRGG